MNVGDFRFIGPLQRGGGRVYQVEGGGGQSTCSRCLRDDRPVSEWVVIRRDRIIRTEGVFCSYPCWIAEMRRRRESLLLDRLPRWLAWAVLILGAFIAGRFVQ